MSENHYAEFSECSMKPQEVLEYVSGPIPVPEEGEVLVRMKAAPIRNLAQRDSEREMK